MQHNNIPPFNQVGTPLGVCVADGHGVKIHVDRRHLVVEDGIGRSRRERRFHRATGELKRLVILGTTGFISLEAVRWLADAGVPAVQIDREGRVLTTSQPMGSDRAALRRAQAWAVTNDQGLQIVRYLLDRKLEGQAHLAASLRGDRTEIDAARYQLEEADSFNELMWLEAAGANHYWHAWADVECQFIKKDEKLIADHWLRFGTRGSAFNSSGPRGAANPINAILNYLYALLEAEAVIACQTVGLDPGTGILHADQRARDSFALDLMEPVRPEVDQWVLRKLAGHHFRASDFVDTRRGICRLAPRTAHWLAETTHLWAGAVGRHAETVAQMLADTPGIKLDRIPTPITGTSRSISRPRRRRQNRAVSQESYCHSCGQEVESERALCDGCIEESREERIDRYVSSAHRELQIRRDQGDDPAHGGGAGAERGATNRAHQLAVKEWNSTNTRVDKLVYLAEILPGLQHVSINDLAKATGLSAGYCSFIRRGLKIPHPRHWPALLEAAKSNQTSRKSARIDKGGQHES